jgi:transcriptional regulator with XRE-family HTH domain
MKKAGFLDDIENFTILENKTIGRNLYRFRKIKDKKASEVAKFVGMGEAAYTKYERGESKITVDLIQKVAEFFKIDPLQLLSTTAASNFVDNVTNSQVLLSSSFHTFQTYNLEQNQMMMRLLESVLTLTEKVTALLDSKKI